MPSGPWHCHHCGTSNIDEASECTFCYHIKCSECPYYDSQTGAIYYVLEWHDVYDPSKIHTSTVGMTPMRLLLEPAEVSRGKKQGEQRQSQERRQRDPRRKKEEEMERHRWVDHMVEVDVRRSGMLWVQVPGVCTYLGIVRSCGLVDR